MRRRCCASILLNISGSLTRQYLASLAQGGSDTASTSSRSLLAARPGGAAALSCDSSACTFCQQSLAEGVQQLQHPFLADLNAASASLSNKQLQEQSQPEQSTAGKAAANLAWQQARSSSPSSSQSVLDMFLAEAAPEPLEADPEDSRKRPSRMGSTTTSFVQLEGGDDDFVSVERADLRHGFSSSTNLAAQQQAGGLEPHKRQTHRAASAGSGGSVGRGQCQRRGQAPCWQPGL